MSINRYNPSRDGNEKEIVNVFRNMGLSVERLNTPLDLLIGYNKKNYLIEVKMPNKKLNKNQIKFVDNWQGQWFMVNSIDQAQQIAVAILEGRY